MSVSKVSKWSIFVCSCPIVLEVVVEVGLSVVVVCCLRGRSRQRLVRDSMSIAVGRSTVVVLQVEL